MIINGIKFGPAFNASGARNITGQGYWYHAPMKPFGLNYNGATFISKTVTMKTRKGNMPLQDDGETPVEWLPKCIYHNAEKALALNCVGLSNFGLKYYLDSGWWQDRTEPFLISFAAVGETTEEMLKEDREFVKLMQDYKSSFQSHFGIQRNYSCPNTGHDPNKIIAGALSSLDVMRELNVPIVAKINLETSIPAAAVIAAHPACSAICMSNTVPFGQLPKLIPWNDLFPGGTSPLIKRGFMQPGGLSGKPLFPLVKEWIKTARNSDAISKPIIACGGILSKNCVKELKEAGANGIEVSSASFLRPTRVRGIIREANRIF